MLLAEYNEKETMEYIRKEQRQIGREEGNCLENLPLSLHFWRISVVFPTACAAIYRKNTTKSA